MRPRPQEPKCLAEALVLKIQHPPPLPDSMIPSPPSYLDRGSGISTSFTLGVHRG